MGMNAQGVLVGLWLAAVGAAWMPAQGEGAAAAGSSTGRSSTGRLAGSNLQRALDRAIQKVHREVRSATDFFEDHSSWETAWRCRSKYYEVRTTKSHGDGMDLARGLDVMLGHFQSTLGIDYVPTRPFQIWVFPDIATYNGFGDDTAGEHSSFYGSFWANSHAQRPVATVWEDNRTLLRMHVTHSAVHQFLGAAFPGTEITAFVDEGLAAYFTLFWDYPWGLSELERMRKEKRLVTVRELVRTNVGGYGRRTHERMIRLGMLYYYLLRYREDTRTTLPGEPEQQAPFRDYLVALLRGRNPRDLPARDTLLDFDVIDKAMREYSFPK